MLSIHYFVQSSQQPNKMMDVFIPILQMVELKPEVKQLAQSEPVNNCYSMNLNPDLSRPFKVETKGISNSEMK